MINVKNVYKKFDDLLVLNAVNCVIEKGEKVVIIGPSGSGKSTLLRCMNLLEKPTFGEVWLEDKLLTPVDPYLHYDVMWNTIYIHINSLLLLFYIKVNLTIYGLSHCH